MKIEIELPGKAAEDDDFQKDEPEATCPEIAGEFGFGFSPESQGSACACEKKEDGRADVGNPAGEEQCGGGLREVYGTDSGTTEIIASVVQRHDDHHETAQQIDGFDARANRGVERDRHSREEPFYARVPSQVRAQDNCGAGCRKVSGGHRFPSRRKLNSSAVAGSAWKQATEVDFHDLGEREDAHLTLVGQDIHSHAHHIREVAPCRSNS